MGAEALEREVATEGRHGQDGVREKRAPQNAPHKRHGSKRRRGVK